jgi:hypothetical protein
MSKNPWSSIILAVLALLAGCAGVQAEREAAPTQYAGESPTSPLYRSIADRDAALSAAFDRHDIEALMSLFDADLEFYHDAGGLQHFTDVKAAFTGVFGKDDGIRRELVPGTLRVYPVPGYGAMELGRHRFCHLENGKQDCGSFEFVHIWRNVGGDWKITRVASYGH